jgi:hypothetical protein
MRGTRDWKAIIDLSEDVDTRLSEDQKSAACRTVAATAARLDAGSQAALEVCLMLGIHPSQRNDDDSFRDIPALSFTAPQLR